MCQLYDRNRVKYDSGVKKFSLDSNVYGHRSVKDDLLKMQHNKCCYCESRFSATSYGAVEHFRPKGAVQQRKGEAKLFPGYYWLAYKWTNLLFSCEKCNTSHKRILFPLECSGKRARNHHDDLDAESPMFIDPSRDDPEKHLRFRGEAIESLTERGAATVRGLGLRRDDLEEARREKLSTVRSLQEIVELKGKAGVGEDEIACARQKLESCKSPKEAYSAMVRDFLEHWSDD